MVVERYKLVTADQRMRIASSMFETARAIIESFVATQPDAPRATPCVR
jgi:hypothetical protein